MSISKVTVSVPVGVSGQFILSYSQSSSNALAAQTLQFWRLSEQIRATEQELKNCNSPVWLAHFFRRPARRNAPEELCLRAKRLEEKRAQLLSEREELRVPLEKQAPGITAAIQSEWTAKTVTVPRAARKRSPTHRPAVAARNRIIKKYQYQSHLAICHELDEARSRGAIPENALPPRWVAKFEVKSFVEAYHRRELRPRVHRVISGGKRAYLVQT